MSTTVTPATATTTLAPTNGQLRPPSSASPPLPPPNDHAYPPQQSASNAQGQNEVDVANPAMAVRLNLMRRVWTATQSMDGPRRRRITFFGFAGVAQIVAFIVVLALTYHDPCDKPLALYLVLMTVRIALFLPISFWQSINARPRRNATAEQREAWERNRPFGSVRLDNNVRRLSDLLSLASIVLFFFGNYWIISQRTCDATAPVLYKTALAALILSWIVTLEVVIYGLLILFFLPFFLIGARWFGLGQAKNEIGPLSKTDIEKLPKRLFVGPLPSSDHDDESSPPAAASADPAPASSPSSPAKDAKSPSSATTSVSPAPASSVSSRSHSRQWWRLWRGTPVDPAEKAARAQVGEYVAFPAGVEPVMLPASQSACSICLCEYELPPLRTDPSACESWKPDEELLRLLPCNHAFHSACLADWLAVSGRCPLCQRAVNEPKAKKGKKGGSAGAGASGSGVGGSTAGQDTANRV
ncbi:hypothetical protein JCM11251_000718 [Rhodosporidiobolus azoricus]